MTLDDKTPEVNEKANKLLICIFGRSHTTHPESAHPKVITDGLNVPIIYHLHSSAAKSIREMENVFFCSGSKKINLWLLDRFRSYDLGP